MKRKRSHTMINRVGETSINAYGSIMEIVEYDNCHNIWVKFDKGNPIHTNYYNFINGAVSNPYDKSVHGVGYLGEGKYKVRDNGKLTRRYETWHGMIQRCYSEEIQEKFPTYKDCSVVDEWHCFQVFSAWYDENFYDCGQRMNLDKDIISKGNKIYSPDTCIFVPQYINKLFLKGKSIKESELPTGVFFYKITNRYVARCNNGSGKSITISYHNSIEEAFQAYKKFKEKHIKQIANEYKDKIPEKLYNSMINYIVEITD